MATQKGVWNLQQVRDKQLQSLWDYSGESALFSWGYQPVGELASNSRTRYSSPVQVPGTTWNAISDTPGSNAGTSLMLTKTDGTLWIVGSNNAGNLGLNQPDNSNYSSPVQIPGTTWGTSLAIGPYNAFAVKTDNTLWSWGDQPDGMLGHNNNTRYSSPTQIPGTTWSKVATGQKHCMAIKTDGTLWAWGSGDNGASAQNNKTHYSSPRQVGSDTTWSSLGGGNEGGFALKTDGTLWSWGYGGQGQLGLNDRTARSSPTQIPGTTWSLVSSGHNHVAAIKTDGTLWVWGNNQSGQIGINAEDPSRISSPTQVPGTTWTHVRAHNSSTTALKTDGTLWAWGENQYATLGLNDRASYSSPTQVPGTWTSSMGGTRNGMAILANL